MPQQYLVQWEIELDAQSPQHAAERALDGLRDYTGIGHIFTVIDEADTIHTIDLDTLLDELPFDAYQAHCFKRVQQTQAAFWAALLELERVTGRDNRKCDELSSTVDYNDLTFQDVLDGHAAEGK